MRSELCGIVVSGGLSVRMGRDKGRLVYHQLEQRLHVFHLLEPFCSKVYISCTALQSESIPEAYPFIPDEDPYQGIGPMAALLNAWRLLPEMSFLLLGCDYPLVESSHLRHLLEKRNVTDEATCYEKNGFLEPLVTVYEKTLKERIQQEFLSGNYSLRQILGTLNCTVLKPEGDFLQSADTPEQREKILQRLKQQQHE